MTSAIAIPTFGKSWSTMQVTNSETRLPMQKKIVAVVEVPGPEQPVAFVVSASASTHVHGTLIAWIDIS